MSDQEKLQKLAELLHAKLCNFSPIYHDFKCSWDYECWEVPGEIRNRYLTRAKRLLECCGLDIDVVIKVLEAL